VTLRFAAPYTPDNLDNLAPVAGGTRLDDRLVWRFEDLEPTTDHDIAFTVMVTPAAEILEHHRRNAEQRGWRGREGLARRLAGEPGRHLRHHFTSAELEELLDQLERLLPELGSPEARVRLPATDEEGKRLPYVRRPHLLTDWVPRLTSVVEHHPDSDRARRLLGSWVMVAAALLEGRLAAGGQVIEAPADDVEELRRDLAAARAALGTGD
jgi:hypothetical protein